MKMKDFHGITLLLTTLLFPQLLIAAPADEVGRALFVRGAVSAQSNVGAARLLEKQATIFEHDRISTGTKSFIVFEMNDGSRITLRPGTIFVVDEYIWKDGKGKANYSLLKGGMRALTGLIGKNNPEASTVTTPYGTIKVRGTEYDARICEKDCAEELKALPEIKKNDSLESEVIGRIAMIKGDVSAKDTKGKDRRIDKGGPVYLGDRLMTTDKSFVVVIFRDDSRLTIRPSSEVVLKDYLLSQESTKESRFVTELLKGGLRTLTGNIGKQNPEGFKVKTASSTMGIRGTGFDVYYKNPTWVNVWSGAVDFEYKDGTVLVGRCEGATGGVSAGGCKVLKYDGKGTPRYLMKVPDLMQWPQNTRPDNKQFIGQYLWMFEAREHDFSLPGLYQTTYDGYTQANNIDIGRTEALYSNGKVTYRLKKIPPFQQHDPYPKAGEVNDRFYELFDLFGASGSAQACEVQ